MASSSADVQEPSSEEDLTRYRDSQADDGANKKKKFKPFKAVRRLFSSRRKKSKPIAITSPRLESVSDDDTLAQTSAPGKLSSALSMSADSIFTADSQKTPVRVGQLREGVSMERVSPQKALAAELKGKLRGRKIDDDDIDDGLPDSPPTHQTTAEVLNQMKEGQSAGSEKSLLSMDSSENEDQETFQKAWSYGVLPAKHSQAESSKSPQMKSSGKEGDIDLDVVQAATLLKSNAAKDKMHLRQKTKAPTRRRNQSPASPRLEPKVTNVKEVASPVEEKIKIVSPSEEKKKGFFAPKEDPVKTGSPQNIPKNIVKLEKPTPKKEVKEVDLTPKKEIKVESPVHKAEDVKTKTGSTFSLKSSPVSPKKDATPLSPESGKLFGGVVLRKRTDKAETDITKRQTVAMGSGIYEDKSKETPIPARNWDDLDKPKSKFEEPATGNSELASMFNKLTRRSSQKRTQPGKEDSVENSNSHNVAGNRTSVASIDVKIASDVNNSNNSRLKTVDIEIIEKKNSKELDKTTDSKVDPKSPVAKTFVKGKEPAQDTSVKETKLKDNYDNVVLRDSDQSKIIKENRSSVHSIDVKIEKTSSVKSSEVKKDSTPTSKVEEKQSHSVTSKKDIVVPGKTADKNEKDKKDIVTPAKADIKKEKVEKEKVINKPTDLALKTSKDEDYRKSSPKMKDRFRSQTMPDATEVTKVKEQSSPSLQRSKTSVDKDSPGLKRAANTEISQSGASKLEPKKIFTRTMEDGSLPPWFKSDKTTSAKVPLPSPTKEPARKLSTGCKLTSPTSPEVKPITQPAKDAKVSSTSVTSSSTAATKANTGAVSKTSNVTASKNTSYGAVSKSTTSINTPAAKSTASSLKTTTSTAKTNVTATKTTSPPASKTATTVAASKAAPKTVTSAGPSTASTKEKKDEKNDTKSDSKETEKKEAAVREKSTICSSTAKSNRQSKVLDLMKNFQTPNVQPVN